MGRTDDRTSQFLSKETVFAEIFNQVMFHGDKLLDSSLLAEMDIASRHSSQSSKYRDVVKKYDDQMVCMILGVENQKDIHCAMPLRIMDYDVRSYEKQRRELESKHRKAKDLPKEEFIGGLAKTDRLLPVSTLVIYWGAKDWEGPRDLHDMLKIPEKLRKYEDFIPNYHMNLLEINKIGNLDAYSDELRRVFGFVKYQSNHKELQEYVQNNENLFHETPFEEYQLIREITHSEELKDYVQDESEGGSVDMCEALKQLKEDGKREGKIEGKLEGKIEGKMERNVELIRKKMFKGNTPEEIAEMLELPLERIKEISASLESE